MTIYQLLFNRLTLFIIYFSVSSVFSVAKNTYLLCGCKPRFVRVFKCRLNNELNQSKMDDYAKQTQFPKCQNGYNLNFNNGL